MSKFVSDSTEIGGQELFLKNGGYLVMFCFLFVGVFAYTHE